MSETTVDYRVEPDGSLRAEPTPGPWRVQDAGLLWIVSDGRINGMGLPTALGHVEERQTGRETAQANAVLMARSPTMRTALERIGDLAEGWAVSGSPEWGYTQAVRALRAIRDEARAALGEPS